MNATQIILTSGEYLNVHAERRDGFESDAGFHTWDEIAALVCRDRKTGQLVTIPVD
jgi:hypothetical protein